MRSCIVFSRSSELPTFRNGEFAEKRKKLKSNRSLCSCAACHPRFFTPYSSDHYRSLSRFSRSLARHVPRRFEVGLDRERRNSRKNAVWSSRKNTMRGTGSTVPPPPPPLPRSFLSAQGITTGHSVSRRRTDSIIRALAKP